MNTPWLRPVDPAGFRTLSPVNQARVARARAERDAQQTREAYAFRSRPQPDSRKEARRG